jgi:hypothetical protein
VSNNVFFSQGFINETMADAHWGNFCMQRPYSLYLQCENHVQRPHLDKLIFAHLIKLRAFNGTRRFIAAFTRRATGPHPEPDEFNPHPAFSTSALILSPIYGQVSQLQFWKHFLSHFYLLPSKTGCVLYKTASLNRLTFIGVRVYETNPLAVVAFNRLRIHLELPHV